MNGEKRRSQRQSLKYPAQIDIGDGSEPRPCVMANVSVSGARVTIANAAEIPDEFSLVIAPEHGTRRRCKVAWRENNQLGLQFIKHDSGEERPRPPARTAHFAK